MRKSVNVEIVVGKAVSQKAKIKRTQSYNWVMIIFSEYMKLGISNERIFFFKHKISIRNVRGN